MKVKLTDEFELKIKETEGVNEFSIQPIGFWDRPTDLRPWYELEYCKVLPDGRILTGVYYNDGKCRYEKRYKNTVVYAKTIPELAHATDDAYDCIYDVVKALRKRIKKRELL